MLAFLFDTQVLATTYPASSYSDLHGLVGIAGRSAIRLIQRSRIERMSAEACAVLIDIPLPIGMARVSILCGKLAPRRKMRRWQMIHIFSLRLRKTSWAVESSAVP
jgi:hypothetical protein